MKVLPEVIRVVVQVDRPVVMDFYISELDNFNCFYRAYEFTVGLEAKKECTQEMYEHWRRVMLQLR